MRLRAQPAHEPRLARIASLVADASRSRMLCYLLGGELASAGELAQAASVSPATASGHLAQLLDAGLLVCQPRGRHRYYRLADGDVAHALEALAMVAERSSHSRSWRHPARQRLRQARCCYGHIAGELGVALMQGMQNKGWLVPREDTGFAVSAAGAQALSQLGLDGTAWQRQSQTPSGSRVAYGCIDWSERRDHMAGKLAVALLAHFVQQGWLRKTEGDRALTLTPRGRGALQGWIGAGWGAAPKEQP
jgi:DNA-binding transcriptional ArsR family regulator